MSPSMEDHLRAIPSQLIALGPGQYLFQRDDPITAIHVVQQGAVDLIRHQEDGSLLVLQKAGPGAIVAEASLYSEHYHCDALAAQAARLTSYAKSDIRLHLRKSPDFAEAWARHLARELQRARLHAEILSIRTVAKRLDAWMGWHDGPMPSRGDWKAIASEIGVSPEALYREMARRRRSVSPSSTQDKRSVGS